jgi:hypothetical protein
MLLKHLIKKYFENQQILSFDVLTLNFKNYETINECIMYRDFVRVLFIR